MSKINAILCITLSINLTLFSSTFAKSDDTCKKDGQKSWHKELRNYLFCEYDSWHLSTYDGIDYTPVVIQLVPLLANFDEEKGNLNLHSWMLFDWDDPDLSWKRSSFDDITEIRVQQYNIWTPDIAVHSAGNENHDHYHIPWGTFCEIRYPGVVTCVPRIDHTIRCQTDFTQWPYDRQNCTFVLTTWLSSSEQIRFQDPYRTVIMGLFKSNGEWTLTVSRVFYDEIKSKFSMRPEITSSRVSIDFILDRVQNQLSGRYISPVTIMMVMTLTTVWLKPTSIERLTVACANYIVHMYALLQLHWVLPHNGTTVPNILIFYACSLVLATIALLLTIILGKLRDIKIESPKWVSSFTAAILRSRVGEILLLTMLDPKVIAEVEADADDCDNLINSNSKTTWSYVAIICGWISFLAFLLTYIIMYASLVPNSSMRPPLTTVADVSTE